MTDLESLMQSAPLALMDKFFHWNTLMEFKIQYINWINGPMLTHTSQVADYGVYMWIIYHVNLLGSKSFKFLLVPKSQLH